MIIIDIIFIFIIVLIDAAIFLGEISKPRKERSKGLISLSIISFIIVIGYGITLIAKLFMG